MKNNDIVIKQLNEAINVIEDFQHHKFQRDFHKLKDVLPLALVILKQKRFDIEQRSRSTKFYAPAWINDLLERLNEEDEPLSEIEYKIFKSRVRNLSASDYKPATFDMDGYAAQYITEQEIDDIIHILKRYFHII